MLVTTTASEGSSTVLPKTLAAEQFSSTIKVFWSVVELVKILSSFKSS